MAPQPAEFTTIGPSVASNAWMLVFASVFARGRSPLWACRAPQHPCWLGLLTLQPDFWRTRMVARSMAANAVDITQPAKKATGELSGPDDGYTSADGTINRSGISGSNPSDASSPRIPR